MKRANKKTLKKTPVAKMNKSLRNPQKSNNYLLNIFSNIMKFICRIPLGLIFRRIIKTILICFCSLVIILFLFLLCRTRSPLSDVFTTGRISILKDRPANITRDIIVDMAPQFGSGGIKTLTQALVTDIAKKRPNWRLLMLVAKDHQHGYNFQKTPNVKLIEINHFLLFFVLMEQFFKIKSFSIFQNKLIQLLYYDLIFCDGKCDLVWDPIGFTSYSNFSNVPRISTIHDTAWFDITPKLLGTSLNILRSKICQKNAIRLSKKIITVSKFSQNRICDKFKVSKDFVKHIPIKLATQAYSNVDMTKSKIVLTNYNLKSQKYFIFCSGWSGHKNHGNLIKAFNKFAQKNSDIKLILVGKHPSIFESRPIEEFSSDRVIIAGFVPDEELGILLKNALAFIHPSVYEGFGMPIIEAMANGIPVACSNVASLPEVAGSAALFFDPFDVNSMTQAMHSLADDPLLRKSLIQKGYEQAKKYSDRDAMVDEYIRVMEEVMHENDLKKLSSQTNILTNY